MNYMRKILGSSSGSFASTSVDGEVTSSASPGVSADSAAPSQPSSEPAEQELLGLTHLNKLFAEFQKRRTSKRSGSIGGSLDEDDEEGQLYAMLPLFCKVFSSTRLFFSTIVLFFTTNIFRRFLLETCGNTCDIKRRGKFA